MIKILGYCLLFWIIYIKVFFLKQGNVAAVFKLNSDSFKKHI